MEGLPSGYRPNVGVCLINDEGMVFVTSRLNVPGAWQLPQGGIEEGEDPRCTAIREFQEEKGVVSAEIIDEVPKWPRYDFPPAVKAKLIVFGEENGMAKHKNDEKEINLANGEADSKFSEWKRTSPQEVIEQAVDYKKASV